MNRLLVALLFFGMLAASNSFAVECPSGATQKTEIDKDTGFHVIYCADKKGVKQGPYESYYTSGQLRSKATFVNGKRNGLYFRNYSTGEKEVESQTKDDNYADGLVQELFKNGKPKSSAVFKDGKQGEMTHFGLNGKKAIPISDELWKEVTTAMQNQKLDDFAKALKKVNKSELPIYQLSQILSFEIVAASSSNNQEAILAASEELYDLGPPDMGKDNNADKFAAMNLCLNQEKLFSKGKISTAREACITLFEESKKPKTTFKLEGAPMVIYGVFAASNDYKGAYAYLSQWLKKEPNDPKLNQFAGLAATGLKDYALADKHYQKARAKLKDDQLDFLYFLNLGFVGKRAEGEKGLKALCKKGVTNVCECIEKNACFAAADQGKEAPKRCLTCEEFKKNFDRPIQECVAGSLDDLSKEVLKNVDQQKMFQHYANCFAESGTYKFDGDVMINFVLKSEGKASAPFLLVVNGNNSDDAKLTNCIGQYFVKAVSFGKNRVKCNAPMNYKGSLKFEAKKN